MSARGGILTQDPWLPGHGTHARRPPRGWTKLTAGSASAGVASLKAETRLRRFPEPHKYFAQVSAGSEGSGIDQREQFCPQVPRKLKCLGRWRSTRRMNEELWKLQASRQ